MPVIFARDLRKCYAGFEPVLRGIDMEAEAGEMVAIMGPSGCGKSTMLHIFGMLHAPDSGSLEILNTDVFTLNREQVAAFRRTNMGFVMQSSNLFDHSTVFENVEFPLIYEGIPPQERWERVISALDLVRLSARVHYRSNRLSGGEQQRVAIARAMVNKPRILLADEPTGALDSRTSRHIMENFRNLCHTGGVCLIMVTHDPVMAEYCDTVYTLEDGVLHCKKRALKPLDAASGRHLSGRSQVRRGAFVTERFSGEPNSASVAIAGLFHAGGLLTRIYSLRDSFFTGLSEDYTMPLAVRAAGCFRFSGILSALWHKDKAGHAALRGSPAEFFRGKFSLRQLPVIGNGVLLAQWAAEDKIAFFIGGPGSFSGAAACAAAEFSGLPFVLVVREADVGDSAMSALAEKAHCLCCLGESRIWRERLATLPGVSENKFIILPETYVAPDPGDAARNGEAAAPLAPGQREALERLNALLALNQGT